MRWREHDVGICSWSLRPHRTPDVPMRTLVATMGELGVQHVHLGLGSLIDMPDSRRREELAIFKDSGLIGTAGQIGFDGEDYSTITSIERTAGLVPSILWPQRRDRAKRAVEVAAELGLPGVSFHLGFVPQSNDPAYEPVLKRVCEIAEPAQAMGVGLLLETGQEAANELLQFLNDLRCQTVEANLDPANFILYGVGDPVEAVETLGRHIRHVHLKDAVLSDQPGTIWGKLTNLGEGQVPLGSLLEALLNVDYAGPLVVESEFDEPLESLQMALATLQQIR